MALEKETQKFISDAQNHIKAIAAKWLFVFERLNKDNGLDFMEFIETDLGYEVKAYIAGIIQTLEAFSAFDADGIRNIENSLEEYVEKIKAEIKAAGGESLSTGESDLAMKDENGNWYTNTGERLVPHSVAMHAIAVNCEAREESTDEPEDDNEELLNKLLSTDIMEYNSDDHIPLPEDIKRETRKSMIEINKLLKGE